MFTERSQNRINVPNPEVEAMSKSFANTKRWGIVAALCISACPMTGCLESSFNLANESRLPRGIAIPPGLTRPDVSVTLDYHTGPKAKFTVQDRNGKKVATATGRTYYSTPGSRPAYPDYDVIITNGITEVVKLRPYKEHDNMVQNGRIVALFYVIDDPVIKNEVLASKGMQ
jgi:hypothetical protein